MLIIIMRYSQQGICGYLVVIYLHADFDSNAFNRNSQDDPALPEHRAPEGGRRRSEKGVSDKFK